MYSRTPTTSIPASPPSHTQNGYLENLLVFQNSLSLIHSVNVFEQDKLNWVIFGKLPGFQNFKIL